MWRKTGRTAIHPLLQRAQALTPLLRDTARDAELARQPLDKTIAALRESGLFALMVPRAMGGHEADLDLYFDVVLTLSRADASMGWLTGFYIEHNLWVLNFPETVQQEVFDGQNHVLAPAALNIGAGMAEPDGEGYRLNGRWQWGTGIVHGTWVMAGGLAKGQNGPEPRFFLLPKADVQPIDTWHVTGMCATGSWDFVIDNVYVPAERTLPFAEILNATSGIAERLDGPLYRTPLMPVLGFAAGLPLLGAAQSALAEFTKQMREKIDNNVLRAGAPQPDVSDTLGEVALMLDSAELLMRDVLDDVMAKRNRCSEQERSRWLSRQAFAVHTCRAAANRIAEVAGASGGFLNNPVQRAVRDIQIASNHAVFAKASRYGDVGRALLEQAGRARV